MFSGVVVGDEVGEVDGVDWGVAVGCGVVDGEGVGCWGEGSTGLGAATGNSSVASVLVLKVKESIMLIQRLPFAPGITKRSVSG